MNRFSNAAERFRVYFIICDLQQGKRERHAAHEFSAADEAVGISKSEGIGRQTIGDEAILAEKRTVAELEGAFVCPEGAAAFAAVRKLRESGWIRDGETVVVLNTGTELKYADLVQVAPPVLEPGDSLSMRE